MCEWKSKHATSYRCQDTPLDGDPKGYCILHSAKEDKDPQQFEEKVKERITKGRLTDAGWEIDKIDLRGSYFPRGFEVKFFGKGFEKPVGFGEATFTQRADFFGATFSQEANFAEAKFFKEAYFTGTKFSQNANFFKAEFSEASFERATFSQEASFFGATFSEMACFALAEFFEKAYFNGAKFTEGRFISTRFEKGAEFDNAEFREWSFFEQVAFGPGSSFKYVRFMGEVRFQRVNLQHCSFLHSNIDKVDFRYCEFAERPSRVLWFDLKPRQNVLRDELEADEAVGAGFKPAPTVDEPDGDEDEDVEKNLSETDTRFFASLRMTKGEEKLREDMYEPVRRLYLELKRNFEDKKDWNTAGDFHYGEMECRRKMKGWLGRNLLSLEALYYWASGYGERPWRALLWWFFSTLLFFPFLYRLSEHDPLSACVWDSVRVATFMKIGIPIEPESWGRIVLTLQYLICPTLLALFALALRRKVKR